MRLELTCVCLLVELANHYTARGAQGKVEVGPNSILNSDFYQNLNTD